MPNSRASAHLAAEDVYDFVERRLSTKRLREVKEHLDHCAECLETVAMVLRSDRPASAEEESFFATLDASGATVEATAGALSPVIASSVPKPRASSQWKPAAFAAMVLLVLGMGGALVYHRYWLPAESRRIAGETMAAVIESRQATGRIPLRYINELERASVTRSGFDTVEPEEEALIANLRAAVDRAPVPEAELALALLVLDDDELDEAQSLFEKVLAGDSTSVDALNGLAVVYYQKAIESPKDSYALLQKGLALLRQAQAAAPEDLRVLYNFGKFYEALDMKQAAIQAWSRYLEKDRGSQWAEEAAYQLAQLVPR